MLEMKVMIESTKKQSPSQQLKVKKSRGRVLHLFLWQVYLVDISKKRFLSLLQTTRTWWNHSQEMDVSHKFCSQQLRSPLARIKKNWRGSNIPVVSPGTKWMSINVMEWTVEHHHTINSFFPSFGLPSSPLGEAAKLHHRRLFSFKTPQLFKLRKPTRILHTTTSIALLFIGLSKGSRNFTLRQVLCPHWFFVWSEEDTYSGKSDA